MFLKGDMIMEELKPCPFCGRKAVLLDHVQITSENRYTIGCEDEWCIGHYVGYPMEEQRAIDAWNKRS